MTPGNWSAVMATLQLLLPVKEMPEQFCELSISLTSMAIYRPSKFAVIKFRPRRAVLKALVGVSFSRGETMSPIIDSDPNDDFEYEGEILAEPPQEDDVVKIGRTLLELGESRFRCRV